MLTTVGRVIYNDKIERALEEALGDGVRPRHLRVHQPLDEEEGHDPAGRRSRPGLRGADDLDGAGRVQGHRLPLRHSGGGDDLQERRADATDEGRDPGALRGPADHDRGSVRLRRDHPGGAPRGGHQAVGSRHQRGRRGALRAPRRAEPHLHDGQLGSPRLVLADPPAGRDARPDGQSEGRDHRATDQGQLHGGPDRARVLHLDPRRPQGSGRHGTAHRRLRLPDAPARRRGAGRDHPPGGLRRRGVHRDAGVQARGRPRDRGACVRPGRPTTT